MRGARGGEVVTIAFTWRVTREKKKRKSGGEGRSEPALEAGHHDRGCGNPFLVQPLQQPGERAWCEGHPFSGQPSGDHQAMSWTCSASSWVGDIAGAGWKRSMR